MKNYDLSGKVALVTGAGRARGLGEGIATKLAECGASVLITDLGESPGEHMPDHHIGATDSMRAVVEGIRDRGGVAEAFPLDVRVESQVEAAVANAVERFGRLDILVNNAGIGYLIDALHRTVGRQVGCGPGREPQRTVPVHQARRPPDDQPGRGRARDQHRKPGGQVQFPAYGRLHGIQARTRRPDANLRLELGPHGITVNSVCPNHVTTGLGATQNDYFSNHFGLTLEQYIDNIRTRNPMRREGKVTDTANAVAFLCSDQAIYINGDSLNVTGGEEMH